MQVPVGDMVDDEPQKDTVREAAEAVARAWKAHGASPLLEPYMVHLAEVLER